MKKCPICERTFDDAMRFCQTDGTPLVEDAPVDLYKTMVARPEDIAAAMPPVAEEKPAVPEEDVLQIPPAEEDPKKTMYASEAEIRGAMAEVDKVDEPVMDLPPMAEPEPPKFIEPNLGAPPSPLGDQPDAPFSKTTPPIPSPFDAPKTPEIEQPPFRAPTPEPPSFVQPEPQTPAFNPFDNPAPEVNAPLAQAEWTPTPAAQDQSWQNEPMQNPQYQPGSGLPAGGQNKTLAIVSLIAGILGVTICCGGFLPSLLGLILGFMARGKANSNPAEYGGAGLALGGIITGALGLLGGIIVWIIYVFYFAAIMASMPR